MSFIELYDFIIYQHLKTIIQILPLSTSQIAHLCNQFNHVCFANFNATFQKHYFFIKIALKLSYFCKKKCKNFERWGFRPWTPKCKFRATRLRATISLATVLRETTACNQTKRPGFIINLFISTTERFKPHELQSALQ